MTRDFACIITTREEIDLDYMHLEKGDGYHQNNERERIKRAEIMMKVPLSTENRERAQQIEG